MEGTEDGPARYAKESVEGAEDWDWPFKSGRKRFIIVKLINPIDNHRAVMYKNNDNYIVVSFRRGAAAALFSIFDFHN